MILLRLLPLLNHNPSRFEMVLQFTKVNNGSGTGDSEDNGDNGHAQRSDIVKMHLKN